MDNGTRRDSCSLDLNGYWGVLASVGIRSFEGPRWARRYVYSVNISDTNRRYSVRWEDEDRRALGRYGIRNSIKMGRTIPIAAPDGAVICELR